MVTLYHSRTVPTLESCRAAYHHDSTTQALSLVIIIGLFLSYCPQFIRIYRAKSSQGFSPFFLLLGATSSACSLLNIIALQWGQAQCCRFLTASQCFENVTGILQVLVQWSCFNTIFILYLYFYPRSHKFVRSLPLEPSAIPKRPHLLAFFRTSTPSNLIRRESATSISSQTSDATSNSSFDPRAFPLPGAIARHSHVTLSPEYRLALSLFVITILHLLLSTIMTFVLLLTLPRSSVEGDAGREHPSERAVRIWALILGISSAVCGIGQYLPQLILTFSTRLVGSLSIPMMLLQVPGSFLFVYTLVMRPGVDWTTWGTYFITGILQGTLLVLCFCWKSRQKRLRIDDWGHKLDSISQDDVIGTTAEGAVESVNERTRLI